MTTPHLDTTRHPITDDAYIAACRDRLDRDGALVLHGFADSGTIARIVAEIYREPDANIGFLAFGTTWGQWLSLPLLVGGVYLIWRALRRTPVNDV